MSIEQLLDKRNASDIEIHQLDILIEGVQSDEEFIRGECACLSI